MVEFLGAWTFSPLNRGRWAPSPWGLRYRCWGQCVGDVCWEMSQWAKLWNIPWASIRVLTPVLLCTAFRMQTWLSMWDAGGRGDLEIRPSAPGWPARLGPNLRKEAAPEQERTLPFLLLCDTKAHPVPNWFTPLRGLFLSSYCQFYPCLNFVVDKQMLLNLGLLSSSLENSSQHLTKGWTAIFQTVFFKALIKTNFGHLQKIASFWWVLLIPTLLTSMTSDKDKNSWNENQWFYWVIISNINCCFDFGFKTALNFIFLGGGRADTYLKYQMDLYN